MAHITHQLTTKGPDGAPLVHTSEALEFKHLSDGAMAVLAACCGKVGQIIQCPDCLAQKASPCAACGHVAVPNCQKCGGSGTVKEEDTRSWHSFYDIANMSEADIMAEVQAHVEAVAGRHAVRDENKRLYLAGLVKAGQAKASGK